MSEDKKPFVCPNCGLQEEVSKYSTKKLCNDCATKKRREKAMEHDRKRRPTPITNISCVECGIEFLHSGKGTKPKYCMDCRAKYSQVYEKSRRIRGPVNSEDRQNIRLKHRYGISKDTFIRMLGEQNRKCMVCLEEPADGKVLYVDHDHSCCPGEKSCGKCLRGVICQRCNSTLGQVMDSQVILKSMVAYLTQGGTEISPNFDRLKSKR